MKTIWGAVILATILLPSLGAAAPVDDAKAKAAGIRKLAGKRLTLYTDLEGKEIDQLPAVFEQAFSQWCEYFGRKESDLPDWRMTGFLMGDKARFAAAGLMPDDLPPFKHGFSRGDVLWLNEQPSDYYRRHLLLHEGTHGFMHTALGGSGTPWYVEGMAEYLATHRWRDGRLTLGYMPKDRDEAPQWGRIRIVQDAVNERRALPLKSVVESSWPKVENENDPYAWCWTAATMLDRHPRYRDRFRQLRALVRQPDFQEQFYRLFESDWQYLCEQWQLMAAELEYGYDVERCAVEFSPRPLAGERSGVRDVRPAASVVVVADRGWQNTGLRLEAGVEYRLTAAGRYQIAKKKKGADAFEAWWCEPNGVSIRYYRGRPLGILLAAVRPDHSPPGSTSALLHPTVVGLGTTLSPTETGTLFLKINDSAGELADNAGEVKVEVRRQ